MTQKIIGQMSIFDFLVDGLLNFSRTKLPDEKKEEKQEERKEKLSVKDNTAPSKYTYLDPRIATTIPHEYIEKVLLCGTGFVNGKERVVEFYRKELSASQRVKAIKSEYGCGGAGWPIKGFGVHGYDSFSSKGIRIKWVDEDGEANIIIPWSQVEKELGLLISQNRYL